MFQDNKYTNWYFKIINNAKLLNRERLKRAAQNYQYLENHHIIPKCIGGSEMVLLTAKEHFICHLLLCKMTNGQLKLKMINALIKMQYNKSNGQERYTSLNFSLIKRLIAEKNSALFKGKKRPKEFGEKISKARKGMKFSNKHKQNLSKAQQKRQANPAYKNPMELQENRTKISNWLNKHIRVHNPISLESFYIKKEQLNHYLDNGYIKGYYPKNTCKNRTWKLENGKRVWSPPKDLNLQFPDSRSGALPD